MAKEKDQTNPDTPQADPPENNKDDKIIEEAKKKADAEKKERIRSELTGEVSTEEQAKIDLERIVRRYIKPDGLFRKGLSSEDIDKADKVLKKSGRKIVKDRASGRLMAVPGWDEKVDTRRPMLNLKDKKRH